MHQGKVDDGILMLRVEELSSVTVMGATLMTACKVTQVFRFTR